jgi:hypothetical protein
MSLTSELSELVELHRQGALTDAEFEIAKAKLLKSGESNTKVRKRQDTPLQERVVRAVSDPHPMRVVASAFLIASTIAAIVFATIVPYKYELSGGLAGDCSGPLLELFQRGEYNSGYDPSYVPPSGGT